MKKITGFIKDYFSTGNTRVIGSVTLITALMIFCNYYYGIDRWISHQESFILRFAYRYFISIFAFGIPYFLYRLSHPAAYFRQPAFLLLLFIAPAIFSLKMALITHFDLSRYPQWDHYWNRVIYWPLRLLIIAVLLFFIWRKYYRNDSFFGLTTRDLNWKPYAVMLLFMIPLIALASAQPDFLKVYPKLKSVSAAIGGDPYSWFYKLLFEISYGSDFVSIELFFRGFLVLAFAKWAGKDVILPMACFYCTIHFGKPLGECISSYFGGILLGIVVYNSRSVFGGLMVHLGIAWLMEIGGYISGS